MIGKLIGLLFGLVSYAVALGTIIYAICFVGDWVVPMSIDTGPVVAMNEALAIDLALLAVFAMQHSVMARPAFKRLWTRVVPSSVERSTYVLLASSALILLFWQWRPIAGTVWTFTDHRGEILLTGLSLLGWLVVLFSTFLINHFELFGLRQVVMNLAGRAPVPPQFKTPVLYKVVRHPLYFGFLVAFWATPEMSYGHLLFASVMTIYILVAIGLEERDLIELFGDEYRRYRQRVAMLIPFPRERP